jgi:S-adenosylmethionine synthetase
MSFVFTSESVTEGHPDKVADQVSDAILDAHLKKDPYARVACETLLATDLVVLAGEITSQADVDAAAVARRVLKRIGYTDQSGISPDCEVVVRLTEQSPDIAQGTAARADGKIGAGDQGLMFGYAENSPDHMPLPISLAHGLTKRLAAVRHDGTLPYLRPDGKSQISVRFDERGRATGVEAVVLAAQHDPDVDAATLRADLWEHVVTPVIPEDLLAGARSFINHTGTFVKGGPAADAGLTGRKIIVDTYGGWVPHGGGAFSGKDPTKVDRSAAYYARFVAKNLVAAGYAKRVQIQVAYSIGSLEPVSLLIDAQGTARVGQDELEKLVRERFDFSPGAILDQLGLRAPIYETTAAYGHFGRDFPWEKQVLEGPVWA